MKHALRLRSIRWAICLAFPIVPMQSWGADAYPAQPPYLSAAVTPNIMLFLDTSGSMLDNQNNVRLRQDLCGLGTAWNLCVNNNPNNWRNVIDNQVTTPDSKMNIAKRVAKNVVANNRHLRFGLFTFRDNPNNIGGNERSQAGMLRRAVGSVALDAEKTAFDNAVNGIYGRTATPLAEGLLEVTRYFAGQSSLYGVNGGNNYVSPIQYRCQKNFTIVITDGDATDDQNLPGTGQTGNGGTNPVIAAFNYTARDSAGTALTRTMSVCTASNAVADDTYNITCPANYESNNTARDFGGNTNRPSAIRDVAMYGKRADLRVGGTDADTKSFDDPKFAQQNMITYTVGFAVANQVLPSAAIVGGGKYYNANNETELMASLTDAVSLIGNVVSNAGGGSASGTTLAAAGKMFQPLFHGSGWWGELKCHQLNASGNISGPCTPNSGAVFPAHGSRNIVSAKLVGSTTTGFLFNDSTGFTAMTATQKTDLGASSTEQKKVINFIRGQSNIAGFRTRPNGVLGDIIDAQPAVISAPEGYTSDTSYTSFKSTHSSRGMVFVGANDGMLHGFATADMTEFVGYVPTSVYPKLKRLTGVDYGDSVTNPHTYFVNGSLRHMDVKPGANWTTLLVGGPAQGGQGYFALDATSQAGMNASAVKWEFTDKRDSDLGYTFGAPVVYNVRTSATTAIPAVILANGYDSDFADGSFAAKNSTLFVINAADGTMLKKLKAPSGTGLSAPAGVDVEGDGVLDYVYAGDDSGRVWRFDLTPDNIGVFGGASPEPKLIFNAGTSKPVIMRPAVTQIKKTADGSLLGNLVIFGTGRLLKDSDRTDASVQTMYAVLDKMADTGTEVSVSSLVQRTVETQTIDAPDENTLGGTFRKVSTSPELDLSSDTNIYLGWYFNFPVTSERLVTSPVLLPDRLLFGTGIPMSSEACSSGTGWLMGLNPLTGSVAQGSRNRDLSFIDVKRDGRSNDNDKVEFNSGSAFISGVELTGIPGEITTIFRNITPPSGVETSPWASSGAMIAMREINSMGVYGGKGGGDGGGGLPTGPGAGVKICLKGSADCDEFITPPLSSGFKVETSTWREIKVKGE